MVFFTWNNINIAESYVVKLRGIEYQAVNNYYEYNLSTSEPNSVRVKAVYDNNIMSEYSNMLSGIYCFRKSTKYTIYLFRNKFNFYLAGKFVIFVYIKAQFNINSQ